MRPAGRGPQEKLRPPAPASRARLHPRTREPCTATCPWLGARGQREDRAELGTAPGQEETSHHAPAPLPGLCVMGGPRDKGRRPQLRGRLRHQGTGGGGRHVTESPLGNTSSFTGCAGLLPSHPPGGPPCPPEIRTAVPNSRGARPCSRLWARRPLPGGTPAVPQNQPQK